MLNPDFNDILSEFERSGVECLVGGHSLPVLGRDNLIRNQAVLGRPQDLVDVDWLRQNPG